MGRGSNHDVALAQRALPLKRLVADLYNSQAGKPVLVIGGGPSAPRDLENIPGNESMFTISANGHAFKIPDRRVDLIMCKDHTEHPPLKMRPKDPRLLPLMEPKLRPYGVPIVTRHYWADYRMGPWPVNGGNSGMYAIALGVFLGGWPVIVTGVDCFQQGTYFHSLSEDNVSNGKMAGYWLRRLTSLMQQMRGCQIRALSGLAARAFGRYRPGEALPPYRAAEVFKKYAGMQTVHVRAKRSFLTPFDARVEIPAGVTIAVDQVEGAKYVRLGLAEAVPDPDALLDTAPQPVV